MQESQSGQYRLCQSLNRGLEILVALNSRPGGAATIMQLCKATGLHRTTVKRLLETLAQSGFVRSQAGDNLYRLTFRVQALSAGFRDNVWIADNAGPLLRALGRKVVWPCSILTLEEDELVVRDSTRLYSPFSLYPGMPGRRLPLLTTAAGRAYLAFCSDAERAILLESLKAKSDRGMAGHEAGHITDIVNEVRSRGYATNLGEWEGEERFGAIAVPVCHEGRAIACLNLIFLVRAHKIEQALEKYLSPMLETAARIEQQFALLAESIE
ncbi:MAG: hypothetical protein JWQ23_101 [Herminiimonas sp.]|nr:hypothetical protein [Herminiimonas sp.]